MASLLGDDFDLPLFLWILESHVGLTSPLRDELRTLRLKVDILQGFFTCPEKHINIENRRLQALLLHIRIVFQSVDLDFRRCRADFNFSSKKESEVFDKFDTERWWFPMNMNDLISSAQQRLELLNPLIHEVYTILSNSSSRSTLHGNSSQASLDNLRFIGLQTISDLFYYNAEMVAPVKEELEAAQKSLKILQDLIGFTAKRSSKLGKSKDIIIHTEFLMDKMSFLLYICSSHEKMNDSMVNEMKMHFSSELQNFRQMYIKALKASKSPQGDDDEVCRYGLNFLYSLRDNILQLSDTKLSFTASNKDQILSLHEDLQFLTSFRSDNYGQISNNFLEHINSAIVDIGCLVYSLHSNDQDTDETELKIAFSDLLDIIKIAKEDCRKAYETYIPESWHMKTNFHKTNARGMIRSLIRILKKTKSDRFRWTGLMHYPFDLLKVFEKEIQSLVGTFSILTTKQQLETGELEIQMKRLNDIKNETESLFSSLEALPSLLHEPQSDWNHKLWLYMLIEEIKHDTSTSKPHRGINPQRKKSITDLPEISKDEPKGKGKHHSLLVDVGIRGIEDHNSNLDLISPQKDEAKAVRLKAGFLKVFLSCKGMWHIEEANLKVLLTRIHSVFQNADLDLQRLWADLNIRTSPKEVQCLPMNMDCLLSRVLSMLQHLEPDIRGAYAILMKSSSVSSGISDDALLENLNTLLENIDVLLKCNTEVVIPLNEELEAIQKSLRFLRNFLGFTAKRCSKLAKLKDLLIHLEFLVGQISCLLYLCCDKRIMNDQVVNEMKMHLSSELQKFRPTQTGVREIYIKALKASKSTIGNSNSTVPDEFVLGFLDSLRDDILELSNNNLCFIASTQEQLLSLQDELKFLINFFTMDRSLEEHSEQDQVFKSLFVNIYVVIIDIGCIIYLLNDDENNEMMARELNKKVSDLVANFMVAKADIRKFYDLYVRRPSPSSFPRTNGQGFISSLFHNLKELLSTNPGLVAPLKHHIEIVQKELLSLREDFGKIAEQPGQCDELQSQWNRFLHNAYQTEFIIGSFVIGGDPIFFHMLGLFIVIDEIKTIKKELKAIKIRTTVETSVFDPSCFNNQDSVESDFPKNNAIMSSKVRLADEKNRTKLVMFQEEAEKIQETLMRGSKKLCIISIVGMPGIGKTTLANSVLQHSSVTYHFHVKARCSVSQVHNKRRLILEILQEVTSESKQNSDDDDVDMKLYQSLKGMRYLILLDDLWDIQPWEDIKASFPNDENGSRIIFTSRFEDIASQAGLESINFRLSPLPIEKSREMLHAKLFGNKICPPELVHVVDKIAANCRGLPLTIDLIAGVLRMKERNEWKKAAESLMTILFEDPQGQCQKVLELSYQNLSDDLKPCFLYFAVFPEDANVPTRDLICLWIAEGFVKLETGEKRSLEDEAKDILNNLINRSLVIVSKRERLGGVTESRVHDLLHEFVVAKAQEESFMLKIPSVGAHDQWQEQYRVCIYPHDRRQLFESKYSISHARAIISHDLRCYYLFENFSTFKLLRVMYLPETNCGYCPEMFTLIHLRLLVIYISDSRGYSIIIQNIHKLWNLETIIMNGGKYEINLLLDKICNMVRLRHFYFGGFIRIRYLREEIWQKASFANLQTLYNLKVSYEEDIEKILKLMPNLVELKVVFYNSNGDCCPFLKLDFLKKLEMLEVRHKNHSDSRFPSKITSFPSHLKRLVLSNFGMPWIEISKIGNLEYLEVLELKKGAFRGPIWNMDIDGQFPRLKCLSLYNLDIKEWNASEDQLSCLEKLHVEYCTNLMELPSCLAEIATLQEIEILWCTEDVEDSAERIKKEQDQMRNEELLLFIK